MTKTPQQTLKSLPRRKARDASFLEDPSENQVSPEAEIASCSVTSLLAMAIVQDALLERDLDRVLRPTGTAMMVTVPGPDCGLPPEKWSSLRYGFEPCGGHFHGTEEAYG